MMSIQDTRCPRCGWRAGCASMEPKPIIDNDGVPMCSWKCPEYVEGRFGDPSVCQLDGRLAETVCEPAVRTMAAEVKRLQAIVAAFAEPSRDGRIDAFTHDAILRDLEAAEAAKEGDA